MMHEVLYGNLRVMWCFFPHDLRPITLGRYFRFL
jgi:hypothetical protein